MVRPSLRFAPATRLAVAFVLISWAAPSALLAQPEPPPAAPVAPEEVDSDPDEDAEEPDEALPPPEGDAPSPPAPLSEPPEPLPAWRPTPGAEPEPAPAPAPEPAPAPPLDTGLGKHQQHVQLSVGVRSMAISSAGYDVFSDTRALDQVTFGAAYALPLSGSWSLAGVLGADLGGSSAHARGQQTDLGSARFGLGPELRYHLLPRLYFHGRISATLTRTSFELTDSAAAATLSDANYRGGFDVALGGAFEVLGDSSGADRTPRGWVVAELGYGWAGAHSVSLSPEGDDAPARVASLELPEVALRGVMAKLSVAISF